MCFPSSVFRQTFSVKHFPSSVFRQVFTVISSEMFVAFGTVGFSDSKVICKFVFFLQKLFQRHLRAQFAPTWAVESSQERPKSGQETLKRSPRAPQSGPRVTQERPRAAQEWPKSGPRAAKSGPRATKSDPRAVVFWVALGWWLAALQGQTCNS